jgi:hypothetical protein
MITYRQIMAILSANVIKISWNLIKYRLFGYHAFPSGVGGAGG